MQNLKNKGLKTTTPRLKILELFQTSSQRHLSAEDVYRSLVMDNQDIGLATVYRVLAQFEQAGMLSRNHFANKAVYELADAQHHDHLVCLDCGKVEEFFDADIEAKQHAIAQTKGFELADHALSLYAHCTKQSCPSRHAVAL